MNYWLEALECALDEVGCFHILTSEQRVAVAKDMERAHDMHSEATGSMYIPHPAVEEAKKFEAKLKLEMSKIHCRTCDGNGTIYTQGPHHGSSSRCWKCNGEGKHVR